MSTAWYLLIHQLPSRPLYLRAKVRGQLARAGAVALKDSVYALPQRDDRLAGLRRIAEEALAGGGEAFVCEAGFVSPEQEGRVVDLVRNERSRDYGELAARVRGWAKELQKRSRSSPPEGRLRNRLGHARRRLARIREIDFFDAPGRSQAEAEIAEMERRLEPRSPRRRPAQGRNRELQGRTWVTRRGVQIDRIASAWFVRRFIDPHARFRFLDHAEDRRGGEIRFDMADGDFTHEDDRCTLETLVGRTGVRDAALGRVAEIVHDVDIKDGKFGRPEARGVEQLVLGIVRAHGADDDRLERGFALLDDLYQSFSRKPEGVPSGRPTGGPS